MNDTVEIAERHSATRVWLLAGIALLLIYFSVSTGLHPDDGFLLYIWPAMLWSALGNLLTGGYALKPSAIRELMNDELSLQNRAAAIRFALVATAVLATAVYYYTALVRPLDGFTMLRLAIGPAVAAGLLWFAWLERR